MANTNLFIMSKGSKPGDTPTVATNPNAYYDTPTNPLVICTDTNLSTDTTIACYEIRKDDSLCKNASVITSGVVVNHPSAGTYSGVSEIAVDITDPRTTLKNGHHVYKSDGTFIGTISSMTNISITFTSNIAASLANNTTLYTSIGVSNSGVYPVLNRFSPNALVDSQQETYEENLENTPGYKILCAKYQADGTTISSGITLSSIDLTTDDYFVMLNADNPLTHHFAKLTKVTTSDVAGDSFEFTPKFGSEVPKGTKFSLWKGPAVTDTAVVAVGYGLFGNAVNYGTDSDETDGTGTATDSRHAGMTYISTPLFFFYNDRLNKKNQLDHNTKYMLHYSRSDDGSETHYQRCFLTCQDYGLKVIDYSPYTMNATMVDMARSNDAIQYSGSTFSYAMDDTGSGALNSYGSNLDVADWNKCFINNQRNTSDLKFGETWEGTDSALIPEGSFTGPTKYLHYDSSPDLSNIIPEVLELNVFESITESGGYVDARIVDSMRIYGTKIQDFDTIKIKKIINDGTLSNDYVGQLPGTITGSAGDNNLQVQLTNIEQDVRVLLKSGSSFEEIKIGDHIYNINSIDAPNTSTLTQNIEISTGRLPTTPYYDGSISSLETTITDGNYYRKPWSKICENLIVDFTIDTKVNYTNPGLTTQSETIVYGNNTSTTSSASGSRLYNAEIVLTSGKQTGLVFKIDYGDSNHNIIKLQTPRLQLYRSESADEANFLDYYNGRYTLYKTIFIGEVESLENYIEDGMLKYHLSGRNKINKLLGPIVNKDYKHSDDIIYSTYGPLVAISDTGYDSSAHRQTFNQFVTYDGSGEISPFLLTFDSNGALLGKAFNTTGNTILFNGDSSGKSKVSLENNDSIFQQLSGKNIVSLSKALEANPKLSNSPTSLKGSSNKGFTFTSGNKLTTDVYGVPTTKLSTYVGTSSNSNGNALGYFINNPKGVDDNLDLPFMMNVKDEIENTNSIINTVNSLTEYEVIDIDSAEGTSLIELAPNCPVIMGRIDQNPEDVRFETLTATTINIDQSYSRGHTNAIEIDDDYAATNSAIANKYIYTSDGTLLGKVLHIFDNGDGSMGCAIVLDRALPVDVTVSTILYTSTSKTHGLYLINTQGLRNGGILQLTNSILNHEYMPTIFNVVQTADGTQTYDASNPHYCAVDRYGPYNWRYLDLQKGQKGSISYVKRQNISGDLTDIYSAQLGEFNAYSPAFRFYPGISTTSPIINFNYDSDYSNEYQKLGSHETRNVYPVVGSNFADYDKYSSNTATHPTGYSLMPRKRSATLGGPWNIDTLGAQVDTNTQTKDATGYKKNAVKAARDRLEIIDPKVISPFLFTTADLYPDSMTRSNHIGNVEREFSDYSIMLKSKPIQIKSSTTHDKYTGQLNQLELTDNSYETLQISSASIKTNQMRRLGLMRLTEVTFDWHFNMIDPENIPNKEENNVPYFKYTRYQKLTDSSETISSISGAVITCTNSVTASKFPDGSYVFDSSGNYLGAVNSSGVSGNDITLTANVNKVNGSDATGNLYYVEKGSSSNNSYHHYYLGGRDGDNSFTNFSEQSTDSTNDADDTWGNDPRPLNMLQMAIFNGYGSTTETISASTTTAENDNDEGYGMSNDTSFKKYFIRKMDMAAGGNTSRGYLNHLVLPPVFEGYILQKLYKDSSDTDVGDTRMWCYHSSDADETSGTTFQTNASRSNIIAQLAVGDKIYTDNGEFIGTFVSANANTPSTITIVENLNTTTPLNYSSSATSNGDGTFLCKGGTTVDSKDIGVGHSDNLGGGHALETKEHIAKYATAATASTIPDAEYVHPSRVLESITDFLTDTTKQSPYSHLRAVALRRHNIEGSGGIGGYNEKRIRAKLFSGMSALMGGVAGNGLDGDSIQQAIKLKVGSDFQETVKDYPPMLIATRLFDSFTFPNGFSSHQDFRGEFAKFSITKGDDGVVFKNRGETTGKNTICDGGEFVFKPIFNTQAATVTYSTNTPNGSSVGRVRIRPDTDAKMKWLEYSPNLTGCYLVATNAQHIVNNDQSSDNLFSDSTYNRVPKVISYIISHEISRTDSVIYHDFIIDNMASSSKQNNYKIMRPNHVCFYPNSPSEIDLYKLDYKYTKKADSEEMYNAIPHLRYYEDGWKVNDVGEPDYGEGIQSMYVVINPDHTSTETYLIPRGVNYDHDDKLFGDGKTFEDGSYDMLCNDGINKERKTLTTRNFGKRTRLTFNSKFENKMSGVMSLGEIFSVETSLPVNLKNVEKASIGTAITIGVEAEEIINDVLETNNVVYTDSDTDYPYFASPDFQGTDVYNTIKYLASFKDKEILIDKSEIKLIGNNATVRYTDIEINENDNDIKVIEINQNKSKFDNYNEIIVYGRGVKSVRKNIRSIEKNGKKTLEESNNNLTTQSDVDNRARALLALYSSNEKGVSVKIANSNLEWLKSGDIIIIDYPSEHIPRSEYIVLEVKHETTGILEIDTGTFSKELDSRLAEMIISQKRIDASIRGRNFKTPSATFDAFDSLKLKPIQLIATKSTVTGHTPLTLSTTLGFGTLLKIGTRTTTEVLREDLT